MAFHFQVGSVEDYASGLVVNRLSVSADVLLPRPCSGPPEQITPTTSGKLPITEGEFLEGCR